METVFGIAIAVLAFLAFPAMSRRSLKELRDAPEFPHREEMLWGAKYGGWVTAFAVWGPYYGAGLWHELVGTWLATSIGIAFLMICVFGLMAQSALYWQMAGAFFSVTVSVRRLKQRPTDTGAVLAALREQTDSRGTKILRWLLWLGAAFWIAFIATFGVPVDRYIQAAEWQNRIEDEISAELDHLPVDEVYVSREWGEFTPGYPGIDDWTPMMSVLEGAAFYTGLSALTIDMQRGASPAEAEQAAQAAERMLARRKLTDEWIVTVHNPPLEPIERTWPLTGGE